MESGNGDLTVLAQFLRGKSIALVGPSPHLENLSLGETIDSYDVVLRVNELSYEIGKNDFGSRTDVVFIGKPDSARLNQLLEGAANKPAFVVLPKSWGDEDALTEVSEYLGEKGVKFLSFNLAEFIEDRDGWPDSPSTGFLGIILAALSPSRETFICGFSFFTLLNSYSRQNSEVKRRHGYRTFTVSGHKIEREVSYLQRIGNSLDISYDDMFRKLIIEQRFKGRNRLIFFTQVALNSLNGILERLKRWVA